MAMFESHDSLLNIAKKKKKNDVARICDEMIRPYKNFRKMVEGKKETKRNEEVII